LRGIFDNDESPEPQGAPASDEEGARSKRLHVAIVGPDGKEHHLAPISFTPSRGYARAQSPIEEDSDRTLRFVVEDGEGPYAIAVAPARAGGPARRIPDAIAARLHAGRGIAVGDGHVLASLDGGATWSEVPATAAVLEAASIASGAYEDPGQLAVSELGAKI